MIANCGKPDGRQRIIRLVMRCISAVILLLAIGCDRTPQPASKPPEPKQVMATVYPVAQIVQEIGGKRVQVEWLIESGRPLVEAQGTQQRNSARLADLVISRGGSEEWMRGGENEPGRTNRIIRLETFPAAKDATAQGAIWLDPKLARELAAEIAKRLSIIDPGGTTMFEDNLAKFQQQLDAIFNDAQSTISRARQRKVLCSSDLFTPLMARFGLEHALPPVETSQELSGQRVREMRNVAQSLRLPALLVSSETSAGVIRDLTDKVGVPVLTLDPLGTSAPTGRHTYLQLLRYNLDQLIAGLGLKTSS